jgi:hypothetical protein
MLDKKLPAKSGYFMEIRHGIKRADFTWLSRDWPVRAVPRYIWACNRLIEVTQGIDFAIGVFLDVLVVS